MKLPLKLGNYETYKTKTDKYIEIKIHNLFPDLLNSLNETIDYIEQLEERIRDLEKNELY